MAFHFQYVKITKDMNELYSLHVFFMFYASVVCDSIYIYITVMKPGIYRSQAAFQSTYSLSPTFARSNSSPISFQVLS
jgi:hypothetical protein